MSRGRFITLEGGEGTGKSTQTLRLAEALRAAGHDVVVTREPGGTALAERIRGLILEAAPSDPRSEFLLFAAARCEHIATTIEPALRTGQWVICDRYIDSTRVYQGAIGGISGDLIWTMEQSCVAPVFPDLTLVLDMSVMLSAARVAQRGSLSRFEQVDMARYEEIRQGFLDIAAVEPERCMVIAADAPEDEVAARMLQAVQTRFDLPTA